MFSFGNTGSDRSSIIQFAKHTHNGPDISSSKSPWNLKQKHSTISEKLIFTQKIYPHGIALWWSFQNVIQDFGSSQNLNLNGLVSI